MDLAQAFLAPSNTAHRQYEALRAYFVDEASGPEVATRFGYTIGSFHQLVHQFRQSPDRQFFVERERTTKQTTDVIRQRIGQLRKQNFSVYDISEALKKEDISRTPMAIAEVLRKDGFAKLPRRRDDERPVTNRPTAADRADVRSLDLQPRSFRTKFGGLYLFLPALVSMSFNRVIGRCGLPGSDAIPAAHAMRSLLALKLFGTQRHMHVMSAVLDEGLALFAGLNVIPKRSFLAEYSSRIDPECYPKLMRHWFNAVSGIGLAHGASFDLDFHTVPFHGDDPLLEKHYVSKRSRAQKGILAFLVQDAEKRCFCYGRCDIRREEQSGEIVRFANFWKDRTGEYPRELIFDSRLTTHCKLNELNHKKISFITLRRRTPKLMEELKARPRSAWRKIELAGVSRMYRSPRILDDKVRITEYDEPIRQITVNDLGHEEPTLLLTNQLRNSPTKLVERYAQRMSIDEQFEGEAVFIRDSKREGIHLGSHS